MKCAKSDTWDPATTENISATRVDDNTIRFTTPEGVKVCVTYPPEQMKVPEGQNSVTNHAEVNGVKLEATTTIRSNGGTNGDGTVKPNPESSKPSTPSETPKEDRPQSDPIPSPEKPQGNSPKSPAPTNLARTGSDSATFFIGTGLLAAGLGALAIRRMSGDKK